MTTHRPAFVLDIETRPDIDVIQSPAWSARLMQYLRDNSPGNIKDPAKLEKWREGKITAAVDKAALTAHTGLVAMVGISNVDSDNEVKVCTASQANRETEADILKAFADEVDWYTPGTQVVTWGGRRFDLPFLAARCGLHGIQLPSWFPTRRSYRESHVDLCEDVFGDGKLSDWQYTYGLGHKDVEGAALLDISMSDLEAHLRDDLRHTKTLARAVEWAWRKDR